MPSFNPAALLRAAGTTGGGADACAHAILSTSHAARIDGL